MISPHTQDIVLCCSCLAIAEFTIAKHNEEEFCKCGGQWCGCSFCQDEAKKLFNEDQRIMAQAALIDEAKY